MFIVAIGKEDEILPLHGVEEAYQIVQEIYKTAGAMENCRMEVTPKRHWWCEDIVWSAINEEAKKLGW